MLDGDEWIVNGQKLWSTSAHHADYGMLLARTDWDVPKHRGITWFVLPMHQAGVEARPLRQMNGYASFNEVFLTDARVPVGNAVGRPGDGWTVARTTLAHERGFASMKRRGFAVDRGRALQEAEAEAAAHFETYRWYPQHAGRVDLVVEHARARRVGSTTPSLDRRSPRCCRCNVHTSGPRSGRPTIARSAGRRARRVHLASSASVRSPGERRAFIHCLPARREC